MVTKSGYDAVVVGSGPNGLSAAITLARSGFSVMVIEAEDQIGGGARTAELNLPGFKHDLCSAIHPLGLISPLFKTLPLNKHGLEWVFPPAALAHPLGDGTGALLEKSIHVTATSLGRDATAYTELFAPLVADWNKLAGSILAPLRLPEHPLALARFGLSALRSAAGLARSSFKDKYASALLGGMAAHGMIPLDQRPSAAFGLVLGTLGHVTGWPIPRGGSQMITNALASYFQSLGGVIKTGWNVKNIDELPPSRAILLDVTPRQILKMAGHHLPEGYRRQLQAYRYGPGVFKIDYALSGPVPWKADVCKLAGTVHLGGTLLELVSSERQVAAGKPPENPFVLVAQQSLFDPTRAPAGKHTLWTYCHVPNGSDFDMTGRLEAQIERFAPGFRDLILAKTTFSPADLERHNQNYIGGDINGGLQDFGQLFTRPVLRLVPYSTPRKGLYICSSSTPPGGGVHGMCGYFAARAAISELKTG